MGIEQREGGFHNEEISDLRNGRTIPSVGRHSVTVFNYFNDSEEMAIAPRKFRGLSPSKRLRLDWPVKRDLILYFVYCIG